MGISARSESFDNGSKSVFMQMNHAPSLCPLKRSACNDPLMHYYNSQSDTHKTMMNVIIDTDTMYLNFLYCFIFMSDGMVRIIIIKHP